MKTEIVEFTEPVTLLGGGWADPLQLRAALKRAPRLVAADGGANMAMAEGLVPERVIGDFDSVNQDTLQRIPEARRMRIADQDTTDFEKCIAAIRAPFVLGLGFLGVRLDHVLAVQNALVRRRARNWLLWGEADVVMAAPARIRLDLEPGMRLSLFPMRQVQGDSRGLRWPIAGLPFAPDGVIGTSNEVTGPVELSFDRPGMLVILPASAIDRALAGMLAAEPFADQS